VRTPKRIRIRDKRTEKRYFIDNVIIDHYGPTIGVYGIAVYNVLVRYSNADTGRDSWPSHRRIAYNANCSVAKVKEVIKQLAELGLVKIVYRYNAVTKSQTSNEYLILEPPVTGAMIDTPPQYDEAATKNPPSSKNPHNHPPKKQADDQSFPVKEEYVELDEDGFPEKSVRPLVAHIQHSIGKKLTPNQQRKLAKGVSFLQETHPSPCTLFERDPLYFRQYVDAKIAWALGDKDGRKKPPGSLISAICNYDDEHFGWLNFKQESVAEVEASPVRHFKPVEEPSREDAEWQRLFTEEKARRVEGGEVVDATEISAWASAEVEEMKRKGEL
jgi:hypothetical protein